MKILVVDDNKTNLTLLKKLATSVENCSAIGFISPEEALQAMPDLDFDIGVIDFQMPVYNGVDLLMEIRRFDKYRDKPFVVVTADGDTETRMTALNAGAIDFLTKPINPLEFQARIRNLVALTDARNQLAEKADWLRREVDKVLSELREREQEIIYRLTLAASYKDPETALHTLRVGAYSEAIAKAYGLAPEICADIRLAAPMHDIGKVGIPDAVLLKRGVYTETEREQMQCHTSIGSQILGNRGRASCNWPPKSQVRITSAGTGRGIRAVLWRRKFRLPAGSSPWPTVLMRLRRCVLTRRPGAWSVRSSISRSVPGRSSTPLASTRSFAPCRACRPSCPVTATPAVCRCRPRNKIAYGVFFYYFDGTLFRVSRYWRHWQE